MHVLIVSGSEVAAWVAAIAGGIALVVQAANAFRKRVKERDEIDEALDRQPMIRQQLELGNVGEAVKYLNAIIVSQATHISAQDQRLAGCDDKIAQLVERAEGAEREAEKWEDRYSALERKFLEMEKTYARTIAQLKNERGS